MTYFLGFMAYVYGAGAGVGVEVETGTGAGTRAGAGSYFQGKCVDLRVFFCQTAIGK